MFGITVERVSQAIVGELTVEEAVARHDPPTSTN
jgi:hypothetical protein